MSDISLEFIATQLQRLHDRFDGLDHRLDSIAGQTEKKRVGRPRSPGRRPVVSMRLHEALYEHLCDSAALRRLTLSEEIENRLQQSFHSEEVERQ